MSDLSMPICPERLLRSYIPIRLQQFRNFETLLNWKTTHTHTSCWLPLSTNVVTSQKPSPSIGPQNWVVSETMRSIIALHYCWNASTTRASRYWSLRNSWEAKRVCRLTFGVRRQDRGL